MAERPKKYNKAPKPLTDDAKIVKKAKERYKVARDAQSQENNRYKYNIEFAYKPDGQWDSKTISNRKLDNRPCLSNNLFPVAINAVVNNYKMNTSGVKVIPADNGADKDTAEILTSAIRSIEAQSNASMIKGHAMTCSVAGNKGFFRVVTKYVPGSFDQEIWIEPVVNPLSVTYDPDDTSLDGSGWKYCFVEDIITKDEFEARYPNEDVESWSGDDSTTWVQDDGKKVKICEYFYKEMETKTLCLLETGETVYEDDLQPDMVVQDKRDAEVPVVRWCILGGNAKEPLEKKEYAGTYIPIIPVWGSQVWINGKRELYSAMEYSQDSQKMLNFWVSTEAELLSMESIAPYMLTTVQVAGLEEEWADANHVHAPYRRYNPDPNAPPPQRQGFAAPPSGVLQGAENARQAIRDTSGIQQASLGQQSNETSGRAINARAAQGDKSTFQFIDNMRHADRLLGVVLVDLMPKIYDTPRWIRIMGVDGAEEMKQLNAPVEEKDKNGNKITKVYDISVGRYDVIPSSAPSFMSLREESQERMATVLQGNPQLMQTHGDLIFKTMDIPYAEEWSERSKKMLPPGLSGDDEEGPQIPPEVQGKMEQMQAQMQEMDQALQQQAQELQSKQAEEQFKAAELELKAREVGIKEMQAQAQLMQASQRANVNVSAEVPHNPETDLTEADKLEIEIAAKQHEKELERQHQIRMAVINAKLSKGDEMMDMDEMGEDKPSEMACHMATITEGLAKNLEVTQALVAQVGQLANAASLPKVPVYDKSGKIIRVDIG